MHPPGGYVVPCAQLEIVDGWAVSGSVNAALEFGVPTATMHARRRFCVETEGVGATHSFDVMRTKTPCFLPHCTFSKLLYLP